MHQQINIEIAGLGIVIYSPFAVSHIADGEDYLTEKFWDPMDVARHVNACHIACFCTGSPGTYILDCFDGQRDETAVEAAAFKMRLGIEVRDSGVCIRDLYDLMEWSSVCPEQQCLWLDRGLYRMTIYSSLPASGIVGDDQMISIHFEAINEKPAIHWDGVPSLC
jgi:hypothetical protein